MALCAAIDKVECTCQQVGTFLFPQLAICPVTCMEDYENKLELRLKLVRMPLVEIEGKMEDRP